MIKELCEWFNKSFNIGGKILFITVLPPLLFTVFLIYKVCFLGFLCETGLSDKACEWFASDKPKVETHDTK